MRLSSLTGLCMLIVFHAALVDARQQTQPKSPQPSQLDVTKSKERTVKDQVLISDALPAVKLKFKPEFAYLGSQTFILYENARAEQHFFVHADEKGAIKSFYLVQFEGFLPTNNHTYQYKATKTAKIGDLEFIADASFSNVKTKSGRPDSDANRAGRFFSIARGFAWPVTTSWPKGWCIWLTSTNAMNS